MKTNYDLKAGDYICFDEGEYEDNHQFGHRQILKNFNIQEEAKKYIDEHKTLSIYDFLECLDEKGLTKPFETKSFYIGSGFYDGNDFNWFDNFSSDDVEKRLYDWQDEEDAE